MLKEVNMSRRKTHEEYINEVKDKNPNIEVLGVYVDAKTAILHKCKIDGYEWYAKPNNILSGKGCPMCAGNIKFTHEQYVEMVSNINPYIKVLGQYINAQTHILHRCTKHDIEWMAIPECILNGKGCRECMKEKIRLKNSKTHEQYVEELHSINPNIIVIEKYCNANTPILHQCVLCGNTWKASPANILYGTGCPKCNASKGEKFISVWLDNNNIKYIAQKSFDNCRDRRPLPFDFYLPNYNICIEYQGEQHYRPVDYFGGQEQFELQIKHDKIKVSYCKENNIELLCIKYDEDINEALTNFLFI